MLMKLTRFDVQVNSQTFGVVPQISWPYQANGIGSIPSVLNQSGIELGSYSTSTASPTSAYYASSNHAPASSARISSTNSYTAAPYHSMPNRSEYGSAFGSNTIDGVFDTYSISPAHYMLPGQETQTGLYGHQDNARQWPLSSRCSIGFEPDSPSRYNSSCLGYGEPVLPSGQPSNDASSYFHMGNLATTLPVPVRSTTRALPNPQRLDLLSFHPTDNIAGPQNGLAGDLGSFVAQNGTSRPSVSWGPERVTTGGSLTPTSTASSSASVYPLSISSRKTSTPPTDIRQTEFGYVTHSPPTNSATPTAESTSTLRSRASKASMEGSSLASSSFDHLSSDPFLRRDYSTSSLYTYSTGSGSKSNSVSSLGEPTLLNGQPYTSLRPPQPQDSASVDAQRRSSAETASRLAHRPSITSVGSARR
ncbi:hypothetical protein MMC13_005123 [Lambiella insularis]|nr:hypothetical protein [Lambiella insularis]